MRCAFYALQWEPKLFLLHLLDLRPGCMHALGDGRLVGIAGAVPPRKERAEVLGRRRRREGPLEPAARRRGRHARVVRLPVSGPCLPLELNIHLSI